MAAAKKSTKRSTAPRRKAGPRNFYPRLIIAGLLLILLSPFYYGYVLKTFYSSLQWFRDIGANPRYRDYKGFNIYIPTQYPIHGIDVSYAQGKIDWQKVKAMREDSVHITFAFIKATEGLFKVDPYFKRNWREGPKAGIICGAYHFFRPNENGLWQARFFLQNADMDKDDLPPVVDVETLDGATPAMMRKQLKAFLGYVGERTKTRPVIYTHLTYYTDYLAGYFDDYPVWVAHYDQPDMQMPRHKDWVFWQHSDKARVDGIAHTVDFDVYKGDSLAFRRMLIQ